MLINFSLENWRSFEDRARFSLAATREKHHRARVPYLSKYGVRVLPAAAVYGANASGKTNLFAALWFVRSLVVKSRSPEALLPVEPFLLSKKTERAPARFAIEFLGNDESIYELSLSVDQHQILEEKLVRILGTTERTLYDRIVGDADLHLDDSLKRDRDRLTYIAEGTQKNQLFLSNSISQRADTFKPAYAWFKEQLVLISPESEFGALVEFAQEGTTPCSKMSDLLQRLDTGIIGINGETKPIAESAISKHLQDLLREKVTGKESVRVSAGRNGKERFTVFRGKDGSLSATELLTYHSSDGTRGRVRFRLDQESDGSLRVIDLLPAFLDISEPNSRAVYVIDEIDRSLHTLLTRSLIEAFLDTCSPQSRAQLLFTTHDVFLMDQQLLRRDEMWITERNASGSSKLTSFGEFKDARKDASIRKSYLQGRMGGIPRIFLNGALGTPDKPDQKTERKP